MRSVSSNNLEIKQSPSILKNLDDGKNTYKSFTAEVVDIILDSSHPLYTTDHSIELIGFRTIDGVSGIALPISPYIRQTPVKHETVQIYESLGTKSGNNNKSSEYFYSTPINVWNLVNMNQLPYSTSDVKLLKDNKVDSYVNFSGVTNKGTIDISPGKYINQTLSIPRLKPFEGDIIYQGRFGSTIRFGYTNKESKSIWSKEGNDGDPILIIRSDNNRLETNKVTLEDFDKDNATTIIASNHLIPLKLSAKFKVLDYAKINNKPDLNKYVGGQIIHTSDRIILNSKSDSILLSAFKNVSMSANESITLDSKQIILEPEDDMLIGIDAINYAAMAEPIIDIMKDLMAMISKMTFISVAPGSPTSPAINVAELTKIQTKLNKIKSKKLKIE